MSCIPLNQTQRRFLAALTVGPRRVDEIGAGDGHDALDDLRPWARVFGDERVELIGAGHYLAGTYELGLSALASLP
jgi:hypothetical protein